MSRSNTRQRLTNVLPVAAILLGAGLTAARKRRAARHARGRVAAAGQAPEPRLPASVAGSAVPPDSGLSVVEAVYEIGSDNGDETHTIVDATEKPPARARNERGATTARVLEALAKGGTMTAGEVAVATGIGRATISSTLSRLARSGAVTKADRGYRLPDAASNEPPASNARARKPRAPKPRSTDAPSKRAAAAATVANGSARTAPGATKAKVLGALSTDGGLTAGEVAAATGLGRGSVSTTLSKLAKSGEVVKAERGYRLPG